MTSGRIDPFETSPEALKGMMKLEGYFRRSGLELALIELVKFYASQLNRCAHCLDLHSRQALAAGVSPRKLHVLPAWREAKFYSPRERAALAWTEELTLISERRAEDEVFDAVREELTDRELVDLSFIIAQINSWNRISIAFRNEFVPDEE